MLSKQAIAISEKPKVNKQNTMISGLVNFFEKNTRRVAVFMLNKKVFRWNFLRVLFLQPLTFAADFGQQHPEERS